MRRWPKSGHVVLAAILMLVLAALASRYLGPLSDASGFAVPSREQALVAQHAFAGIVAGDDRPVPPGLTLSAHAGYRVLSETAADCQGRGVYLLRSGAPLPLAIIAPHRGFDRYTGTIAAALFEEGSAAAAAWNSAPRQAREGCAAGDPTRHATHHLSAFSLAFGAAYPSGRIVQLHGFDPARRNSRAAQLADIIVSEGTRTPGVRLYELADCLSIQLHPWKVRVFPGDVAELGALQNRQGQALRAAGFTGFAHLELSARLRRALARDKGLRARFARCLATGLEGPRR